MDELCDIRQHYQDLISAGFSVFQGHDALDEDDFVAAYRLEQKVDLVKGKTRYDGVNIGRFA